MSDLAIDGGPQAVDLDRDLFDHPRLSGRDERRVVEAMAEGDLSFPREGGVTRRLEGRLGSLFETDHVVTTNNGTAALFSALFAVGDGTDPRTALEGVDVLCPSYAWWSAVTPVVHLGGRPVFCEVEPDSLALDVADAAARLTPRTEAVVVPYMWGEPPEIDRLRAFADDHDLRVIEDASHAWGATYEGDPVGSLFDVGCLSMQAGKSLPAGEGGVLVTDDADLYERAVAVGHYRRIDGDGRFGAFGNTGLGYKFRMSPLNAALACSQMEVFGERRNRERELAATFRSHLSAVEGVRLPRTELPGYRRGSYFQYRLLVDFDALSADAATVREALAAEGCPVRTEYVPLLHREAAFDGHAERYGAGALPRTEAAYERIVTFPAFRRGTADEVGQYAAAIEKVIGAFDG